LSTSVNRLSSGLRINSAADDAAGLAIREMMRADVATMNQGIRNTADAVSMIQTADGALGVIDEKLVRMKELAEQAATGTYTTAQREIINSEYQAMAAEIDRIANATNFNGIKLLDGSVTNQHGGRGVKIHFGVSNKASEDYYFVNIGDSRATSSTGLRIGGDAKNDVWGQGAAAAGPMAGPGCCTAGYETLDGKAGFVSGETFSYGYNWDWKENDDQALLAGRYLAGRYTVSSDDSLQDLINKVNAGSQSRVGVRLDGDALGARIRAGGTLAVCVGDEAYVFGSAGAAGGTVTIPASAGSQGFKATGGFANASGVMYSRQNGFSLTKAERDKLAAASVNVGALGLNSAIAFSGTGSGASLAAASADLLARLQNDFKNLGLGSLQSIQLTAGTAGADAAVGLSDVLQSAGGALSQANGAGRVLPGRELTVRTGVFRDANGNWTTDTSIAESLGLSEMVYTVGNPNASSNTFRGHIDHTDKYAYGGHFGLTEAQQTALTDAGVDFSRLNLKNVHIVASGGSNVDADAAFADAKTRADSQFAAIAGQVKSAITVTAGAAGLTVAAAQVNAATGGALPAPGGGFTLATDLYMDKHGNYTNNSSIAAGLQMGRVSVEVSRDASGNYGATLSIDGRQAADFHDANIRTLGAASTSANVADAIKGDLQALFGSRQGGFTGKGGLIAATAAASPPAALPGTAAAFGSSYAAETNADLQVKVNGQLLNGTAASSFNAAASHLDANAITAAVKTSVGQVLGTNARQGAGRLAAARPAGVGNGPATAKNLTGYKNEAAMINVTPERTVSTTGIVDKSKRTTVVAGNGADLAGASGSSNFGARALAEAINKNEDSKFWAMTQPADSRGGNADMVYIFTKEGGNFNDLRACEVAGNDADSRSALDAVSFENVRDNDFHEDGTTFSLGGEKWGNMKPNQSRANLGNEVWNVTLEGRDVGDQRDLRIANAGEIKAPALDAGIINGMDRNSFIEIQNAADGPWAGAEVRTQSAAQGALDAITEAINAKDKIRADLGALQNRLENTMTNLTIQAENLQASESRISDVDVAAEMTEFTKNNVLTQAATSMLAQANSLSQLALSLIR
jgi:flagellin-like hook-associated protein FlgL